MNNYEYTPQLTPRGSVQPQYPKSVFECLMGHRGDKAMIGGWFVPDWLAEFWIEGNDGVVPDCLEQVHLDDMILWRMKENK